MHFPNLLNTLFKATHTGSDGDQPDPVAQTRKSITRRPLYGSPRRGLSLSVMSAFFLPWAKTPFRRNALSPLEAAGLSILETREITQHVSLCPNFNIALPLASLGGRSGTSVSSFLGILGLPRSHAHTVAHSAHPTLPIYVASADRYPSDSMTSSSVGSLACSLLPLIETQCYQMLPALAPIVGWGSGSIPLPPLRAALRADPHSGLYPSPLQRVLPRHFHSVAPWARPAFQSRG